MTDSPCILWISPSLEELSENGVFVMHSETGRGEVLHNRYVIHNANVCSNEASAYELSCIVRSYPREPSEKTFLADSQDLLVLKQKRPAGTCFIISFIA